MAITKNGNRSLRLVPLILESSPCRCGRWHYTIIKGFRGIVHECRIYTCCNSSSIIVKSSRFHYALSEHIIQTCDDLVRIVELY